MPSPKSGLPGSIIAVVDPVEAVEAVNDKSGDPTFASATPAAKSPAKSSSVKAPPKKKVTGPCVQSVRFKDGQARYCSPALMLEIVPPALSGSDTITFETEGAKQCGCSGPSYQLDGSAKVPVSQPASISAVEEELSIDNITDLSRRFHFSPRIAPIIFTCDKDGTQITSGELHVYPNDTQKINWDVTEFFRKHPDVAGLLNKFAEFASNISGKTVDPVKGFSMTAGMMYVQIPAPTVAFAFEGQWKERPAAADEHWEAYYGFTLKVEGTVFSVKLKVDLIYALSYMPQLAPFKPIFDAVWDKIRDRLTDGEGPPFYFGVSGDLKGSIGIKREPDWKPSGSIKLTGSMSLGLKLKAGIVSGEMDANTGLSAELEVVGEDESANLCYRAFKFEGVKGRVAVTVDTGWVGQWGYDREVAILEASNGSWPFDDKIVLIG